ncbi:hypothetical protein BN8_00509 [Fibrisoma limi BUZ 3]|uniref:Uncharacterized protein n=1 Tax=Fibrisoma limi BUZ 3 TaxID=1185876 RepID=I2GCF6_9BACT|nr:hypothetical protein BN8_00509 [Fibrisoma limi BUZ 3]
MTNPSSKTEELVLNLTAGALAEGGTGSTRSVDDDTEVRPLTAKI